MAGVAERNDRDPLQSRLLVYLDGKLVGTGAFDGTIKTLASEEQALQVRYLQTLKEIANEKTNTIVFPMPLELVEPILRLTGSKGSSQ